MRRTLLLAPLLVLAACKGGDPAAEPTGKSSESAAPSSADALSAHDGGKADDIPDSEARPLMQAQVVLDRLGFTPGVVDGKTGLSTRNAIAGFQAAYSLKETGELDEATIQALSQWKDIPATRVVVIPEDFARGPFQPVPKDPADQAKMPTLGYASLDEKLAERFHTTLATLRALNPGGYPAGSPEARRAPSDAPSTAASPALNSPALFRAGQQIRVPNVGGDAIDAVAGLEPDWLATLAALGVGTSQPKVEKIVVSKSKGTLKAYDASDKLVAVYTATMGSGHDPLPLGTWKVNGVDRNPKFHYNPKLFWDASADAKAAMLPPGPNGPVGVVWIDLSKPHYGIHGTPSPETIGRAESHGCVRLTNWDAARLAMMVKPGTQVVFEA